MHEIDKNKLFEEEYKKNLDRLKKITEEKGYILNPVPERVKKVVGLMTKNYLKFRNFYCPCKQSHPLDPAKDVICPCPVLEDEIKGKRILLLSSVL